MAFRSVAKSHEANVPMALVPDDRMEDNQRRVNHQQEQTMDRKDQFIPHLIVSDGLAAIDFYKDLFGAEEGHRMMAADGKRLMHGEIVLDGHKFFLSDQFDAGEGGTLKSPQTLGGTCVRITIEVEDADRLVKRAVAAGAR